jgi:hypothetical protein
MQFGWHTGAPPVLPTGHVAPPMSSPSHCSSPSRTPFGHCGVGIVVVLVVVVGIGALVVVTVVVVVAAKVVVVVGGRHRSNPVRRHSRTMRFRHFRAFLRDSSAHSASARGAHVARHSRSFAAQAFDGDSALRTTNDTATSTLLPPMAPDDPEVACEQSSLVERD